MSKLKGTGILPLLAIIVFFAAQTFAQETGNVKLNEPNGYEIMIHVLVAGSGGGGAQVPDALGPVVKKLKSAFPFADYRVAAAYMNRIGNGGGLDTRSLVQETSGAAALATAPVFQELSLSNVKRISEAGSSSGSVQVGAFRFGARVPVQSGQAVVYEQTGLNLNRVNLPENSPTIIGTLNGPKTSELTVLVLTVRPTN